MPEQEFEPFPEPEKSFVFRLGTKGVGLGGARMFLDFPLVWGTPQTRENTTV